MPIKLAVLIQCHKSPQQVNALLDAIRHEDVTAFLHIDKKSDIGQYLPDNEDVVQLPSDKRIDVRWGQYSQVQATLNLLQYAMQYSQFDYYLLISGQDFPIVSIDRVLQYLEQNRGANYVDLFPSLNNGLGHSNNYDKRNQIAFPKWIMGRNQVVRIIRRLWVALTGGYNRTFKMFFKPQLLGVKYYFGSSWWCISGDFAQYISQYLADNRQYEEFFQDSSCADESFFQTLLMNSPYASTRKEYLHYIDWSEGKSSPKNLGLEDLEKIETSGKLFARKIDENWQLLEEMKKASNKKESK